MARMHSRKKGKSGSSTKLDIKNKTWLRYKPKEAELLVVKLAKEGFTASQIGLHLRDSYGIPNFKKLTGKSISKVLEEKKLSPELPQDLLSLMKKAVMLRKHLDENKKDMTAKRGIQLTESKIRRLVKYYKSKKKLDQSWNYNPEKASFYIR